MNDGIKDYKIYNGFLDFVQSKLPGSNNKTSPVLFSYNNKPKTNG